MVAATSLILPVFNISLCLAGLAGVGGGALISRLLGQHREEEARRVSAYSLYLGIAVAAVFSFCMALFMEAILGVSGSHGANLCLRPAVCPLRDCSRRRSHRAVQRAFQSDPQRKDCPGKPEPVLSWEVC